MDLELRVGPQQQGDGETILGRAGNQGEFITGVMFGEFYEQTLRGNMFIYHIASQALVLAAAGGGHPTVINPASSGRLFVPVKLEIGFTSGTTVIGSVLIAETLNVTVGTGSTIPTATLVDSKNAKRGGGKGRMQWSPTTNTFTAAPTVIASTGINLAPADPVGGFVAEAWFRGTLMFDPGTAMSIVYSVATSTALFHVTLYGLEIPVPPGG